jgi:hypothetical protein
MRPPVIGTGYRGPTSGAQHGTGMVVVPTPTSMQTRPRSLWSAGTDTSGMA